MTTVSGKLWFLSDGHYLHGGFVLDDTSLSVIECEPGEEGKKGNYVFGNHYTDYLVEPGSLQWSRDAADKAAKNMTPLGGVRIERVDVYIEDVLTDGHYVKDLDPNREARLAEEAKVAEKACKTLQARSDLLSLSEDGLQGMPKGELFDLFSLALGDAMRWNYKRSSKLDLVDKVHLLKQLHEKGFSTDWCFEFIV